MHFLLELTLINCPETQKLFGVVGDVTVTRIDPPQKMGKCNPRSSNGSPCFAIHYKDREGISEEGSGTESQTQGVQITFQGMVSSVQTEEIHS